MEPQDRKRREAPPPPRRRRTEDSADIERAVYDGMQDLRAEKPPVPGSRGKEKKGGVA